MTTRRTLLPCTIAAISVLLAFSLAQVSSAAPSDPARPQPSVSIPRAGESALPWLDEFSGPMLDSRWQWLREDSTHWSLDVLPGFLRIVTQQGSLYVGEGKNLLVTAPAATDFVIETKVIFAPSENFQNASLQVYQDDDDYAQIGRYYANENKIRLGQSQVASRPTTRSARPQARSICGSSKPATCISAP